VVWAKLGLGPMAQAKLTLKAMILHVVVFKASIMVAPLHFVSN
jgi:hypothetical protein